YRTAFQVAFGVLLLAVLGLAVAVVIINNERAEKARKVDELEKAEERNLAEIAKTKAAEKKANEALAKSMAAEKKARAALLQARESNQVAHGIWMEVFALMPEQEEAHRKILRKVLDAHQKLMAQGHEGPSARIQVAMAYIDIGELHYRLGENDQAIESYF